MAETSRGSSSQNWTSTQAYVMAVVCLLVGCAVGYLLRGSVGGSSAPAPATAAVEQQQGMPPAGMGKGQQQTPTPEQMKAMADKQAAPLIEQLKSKPNDPALLAQIGNMYFDAQTFPVAVDYYQKSLAVDPRTPGYVRIWRPLTSTVAISITPSPSSITRSKTTRRTATRCSIAEL